jgi:hypothetical protein
MAAAHSKVKVRPKEFLAGRRKEKFIFMRVEVLRV